MRMKPVLTRGQGSLLGIPMLVSGLVLGSVVILRFAGVADSTMTMADPLALADLPPYAGFVSNLGILGWAAGAAVSTFTALALREPELTPSASALRSLLLRTGIATAVFCLDDLFMIHEHAAPHWLGIPEEIVLGVLGMLLLGSLAKNWQTILTTAWLPLACAIASFGVMMLFDLVPAAYGQIYGQRIMEDGAKFFGILCWTTWLATTSRQSILVRAEKTTS